MPGLERDTAAFLYQEAARMYDRAYQLTGDKSLIKALSVCVL